MRVKKVNNRGLFTKGKPIADGTPASTGHYATSDENEIVSATVFFIREKDDGSGSWEEFGLTLTRADYELFRAKFGDKK